ncbi:hypothetical protein [Streptomyces maremycinicus]|uniref:hypothetical protein n=1 Tax=Streptomyces maremycinicus TaxID=1679753 RepID=UPI00078964B5|nr:hypothetical protein [Streptomyces sp. NBRC 110468]
MSSGHGKGLAGSSCAAGDRRYKTGTSSAAETELNEQINALRAQPCAAKAAQVRHQNVTAARGPGRQGRWLRHRT